MDDGITDHVVASIDVDVIDTSAPSVTLSPSHAILWPPNHEMIEVVVDVATSDNSGETPTLTASVASNEASDADGDGNAEPDYEILENRLRAGACSRQPSTRGCSRRGHS